MKAVKASRGAHHLWVGFNSRWGSIVSIFVFDWGSINIFMGWGCNQEWGSNGADTVFVKKNIKNLTVSGPRCIDKRARFGAPHTVVYVRGM